MYKNMMRLVVDAINEVYKICGVPRTVSVCQFNCVKLCVHCKASDLEGDCCIKNIFINKYNTVFEIIEITHDKEKGYKGD
jgi:hypothetical protein